MLFDFEALNVEAEAMIPDDCYDLVATNLNGDLGWLSCAGVAQSIGARFLYAEHQQIAGLSTQLRVLPEMFSDAPANSSGIRGSF